MSNVEHPSHYNECGPLDEDGSAKYEAIKVIEDWGLGFKLGNALKYICRAAHKGSESEDLKKALWYIERARKHPETRESRIEKRFRFDLGDVCDAWGLIPNFKKGGPYLADVIMYIFIGDVCAASVELQRCLEARDSLREYLG